MYTSLPSRPLSNFLSSSTPIPPSLSPGFGVGLYSILYILDYIQIERRVDTSQHSHGSAINATDIGLVQLWEEKVFENKCSPKPGV